MKLIRQSHELLTPVDTEDTMRRLELAARTCYKSEDRIAPGSADKLIKSLIDRGHNAMIEFGPDITVRFITDRGVTHELVRHRICSFAQESTRYCNYSKGKFEGSCTFIVPIELYAHILPSGTPVAEMSEFKEVTDMSKEWQDAMADAELRYLNMIWGGAKPQLARSVLPNSLKTEIVVKANIREWIHIMWQRTSPAAHPQMRALMLPLLAELKEKLPVLFGNLPSEI